MFLFYKKHAFEFLLLHFGLHMSNLRKINISYLKYQLGSLLNKSKKYSKFELCLRFSGSKIVLPRAGDLWQRHIHQTGEKCTSEKRLLIWDLPFYENQMQWQQSYQLFCSGQLGTEFFLKKPVFFLCKILHGKMFLFLSD